MSKGLKSNGMKYGMKTAWAITRATSIGIKKTSSFILKVIWLLGGKKK
ncbi:MAG: hypothetical protein KAJ49_04955 [Arcobacteraceae bacterium]|nr:hypothetical protein [Arcobacteraceae bacterium]